MCVCACCAAPARLQLLWSSCTTRAVKWGAPTLAGRCGTCWAWSCGHSWWAGGPAGAAAPRTLLPAGHAALRAVLPAGHAAPWLLLPSAHVPGPMIAPCSICCRPVSPGRNQHPCLAGGHAVLSLWGQGRRAERELHVPGVCSTRPPHTFWDLPRPARWASSQADFVSAMPHEPPNPPLLPTCPPPPPPPCPLKVLNRHYATGLTMCYQFEQPARQKSYLECVRECMAK